MPKVLEMLPVPLDTALRAVPLCSRQYGVLWESIRRTHPHMVRHMGIRGHDSQVINGVIAPVAVNMMDAHARWNFAVMRFPNNPV